MIEVLPLPQTEQRQWLTDRLKEAERVWDSRISITGMLNEGADERLVAADADAATEVVANLANIELVQAADRHNLGTFYRCSEYVFRTIMGEPWASPGSKAQDQLFYTPADYLLQQGYRPISEPEPGDVITYVLGHRVGFARHFGIYDGGGLVVSKFSLGPVVRHPVDQVPSIYGDGFFFVRKARPQTALS